MQRWRYSWKRWAQWIVLDQTIGQQVRDESGVLFHRAQMSGLRGDGGRGRDGEPGGGWLDAWGPPPWAAGV